MTTKHLVSSAFERLYPWAGEAPSGFHLAELPAEVSTWLEDLLLLRGVPLSYIVPDPRLLPPESIRFFHMDPSWTARLFDGVLAAGSFGSFDTAIHAPVARALQQRAAFGLRARLFPGEKQTSVELPMLSGMLFRSEILRRWPGLTVSAWEDTAKKRELVLARKERLAAGLMIVIFFGVPARVEIAEPSEGTRFGVEPRGDGFSVRLRRIDGSFLADERTVVVPLRDAGTRVLNIKEFAVAAATALGAGTPPLRSSHLSLCLQQQPFVQVFQSVDAAEKRRLRKLRNVRRMAKKAAGG